MTETSFGCTRYAEEERSIRDWEREKKPKGTYQVCGRTTPWKGTVSTRPELDLDKRGSAPVVPVRDPIIHPRQPQVLKLPIPHHHPQIPQLHRLVLPVRNAIPPIPLRRDERDPLRMPDEGPTRPLPTQTPPVPHLDERVVRAREEEVRRGRVGERDGVDVPCVSADAQDGPVRFEVVDEDLAVSGVVGVGAGDDLAAVVGEADGPDLRRGRES